MPDTEPSGSRPFPPPHQPHHAEANTQPAASDGQDTPTIAALRLRPLRSRQDYAACVDLQRLVWGDGYTECVPPAVMKIGQMMGGVTIGAFAPDDSLVGFVLGFTGVIEGRVTHWSHMLAVRPDLRDSGIGRLLKESQREAIRELGVPAMRWTFDPLIARNAHFNLRVLGARVVGYVEDMYGSTGSALHAAGTDRLIVELVSSEQATPADLDEAGLARAAVVNPDVGRCDEDAMAGRLQGADVAAVRVPDALETTTEAGLRDARAWRTCTRAAFQLCLRLGYSVVGFAREGAGFPCFLLAREHAQWRRDR